MKRIIARIMAVLMMISALPVFSISSAAVSIVDSGKCGDSLTWTIDNAGTLSISGTGAMYDFDEDFPQWFDMNIIH